MKTIKKRGMTCQNCGSKEFQQDKYKTACLYCHSEYQTSQSKHKSRVNIWLSLGAIAIAFVAVAGVVFHNHTSKETAQIAETQPIANTTQEGQETQKKTFRTSS